VVRPERVRDVLALHGITFHRECDGRRSLHRRLDVEVPLAGDVDSRGVWLCRGCLRASGGGDHREPEGGDEEAESFHGVERWRDERYVIVRKITMTTRIRHCISRRDSFTVAVRGPRCFRLAAYLNPLEKHMKKIATTTLVGLAAVAFCAADLSAQVCNGIAPFSDVT